MPKWSQEVSQWILEGSFEVPKAGDMNHPTPASEDPCQGEMPKPRKTSIPKDMAAMIGLHMEV